jgi:hypothetical protein
LPLPVWRNESKQSQAEALEAYGYDAEKIAAIAAAVNAYQAIITQPMDIIGARKQITTNLKQLFAELNSTLYDKLDKLVVLFKESHPDFYGEYRTARRVNFPYSTPETFLFLSWPTRSNPADSPVLLVPRHEGPGEVTSNSDCGAAYLSTLMNQPTGTPVGNLLKSAWHMSFWRLHLFFLFTSNIHYSKSL